MGHDVASPGLPASAVYGNVNELFSSIFKGLQQPLLVGGQRSRMLYFNRAVVVLDDTGKLELKHLPVMVLDVLGRNAQLS